jgi:arginase
MELIAEVGLLTSAEIVEVNPLCDQANRTADLAVSLVGALFGGRMS